MSEDKVNEDIYSRPIKDHGGSKYLRLIYPADGKGQPILVDIYAVIEAFQVKCPGRQQAIKKILCAGLRNKGSEIQDLKEVFDAMWRALELQKQREIVPQVNKVCGKLHTDGVCKFCKGPCSLVSDNCGCQDPKEMEAVDRDATMEGLNEEVG